MNILISVDMEGISGIVAMGPVRSEHKECERFCKLTTAEANAAIEGALEGGATRIVVNDSHAGMTNFLVEDPHPAAELISGSPKPLEDALFLTGDRGQDTGTQPFESFFSPSTVGFRRQVDSVAGRS